MWAKLVGRDAEALHVFNGKVDAAALCIFANVAEDVGELEGYAGFFGEFFGARVLVAEDADADEANYGGHEVAVAIEIFEGWVEVEVLRTC